MTSPQIDELQEQQDNLKRRIMESAGEIMTVISAGIAAFVDREVSQRFVQHVAFSESLSDARLAELKRAIASRSEALGVKLRKDLSENEHLWLDCTGSGSEKKEGKVLIGNKAVWTELQKIPELASDLLAEFGFPSDETTSEEEDSPSPYRIDYRTPTWFIQGRHAPGLIESYWSRLTQLHLVQDELHQATQEHRRELLKARWKAT